MTLGAPGADITGCDHRRFPFRCRPAALLRHRRHGPIHDDLILGGTGPTCPTLHLTRRSWRWQPAHRRRWLSWSGPVSGGRGAATALWHGLVHCIGMQPAVNTCGRRLRLVLLDERRGTAHLDLHPGRVVATGWLRNLLP